MVLKCHRENESDSLSVGATVFQLQRVSSRFTRSLRDTRNNGIKFHCLLQVCLGKREMNMVPIHSLNTFFKIFPYCAEIALHVIEQNPSLENRYNRQNSVHEATMHGCLQWYSDVMKPIELIVFPSKPQFLSYGKFLFTSQSHLGAPGKFQPRG